MSFSHSRKEKAKVGKTKPKVESERKKPKKNVIHQVLVSHATSGNQRFEICGRFNRGGTLTRGHVLTLTRVTWGDSYADDGVRIQKYIEGLLGKVTKEMAIAFRDSMYS